MKYNLQKLINPTLFIASSAYVISFSIWMGLFFSYKYPYPISGTIGGFVEKILPSDSIIAYLLSFAIVMLNSFVMAQMNNRFSFIRTRTFMPTFIYLLISTSWFPLHGNYLANLAAFFILIAVFLAMEMYKNPSDVEKSFLIAIFISLSTFLVPEFVFLMIGFWIGYGFLKCFSPKVFFASIVGFITPWVLLMAIFYITTRRFEILSGIQGFFYEYSILKYENITTLIYVCSILFILVVSLFQMISKSRLDVIMTVNELNFFKILGLNILLLFIFRFSNFTSYLPLIAIFYAIFTAYTFTLIKNRFNFLIFMLLITLNVCLIFFVILK